MEILFVIFFILTINIRNFSIKEDTETVTNNLINWWYKLVEHFDAIVLPRFKYSIEQEEEKELFIVRLEILINVVVVMWLLFEEEGWGDWLIAFSWSIVVENLLSTMITCRENDD
ncbi:hypothetical protein T12_9659 [Trichinella patagoniensis]|uniref:Transmembrane protein n=1 Tax=Trichinella patagoniensis TaxID=990121 RepID=A0A0V0ZHB4_9BILA|nr:hypothetical protein T12_9659 [Trichinella patagoniensis]